MSRALPEWIADNDNQAIPARVKVRLFFEVAQGRCQECGKLISGRDSPQYDHRVALINGGQHRENNLQVLCLPCHQLKTKGDVDEKKITYRKRKAHLGLKKKRSITRWRKFNGEIVIAPRERNR